MPPDTSPSIEYRELIAAPLSNDSRTRRRFFTFLQGWRRWLRLQIGRSQASDNSLADRGTDDLLALALLVQFVRDRAPEAIPSLDQLPRRPTAFTLGQLCCDLQSATTCPVLKTVFEPTRYAGECILPPTVIERAFWQPIIRASRRLYGSCVPIAIFGNFHQWCLAFSPAEPPRVKRGARSETRRYDKGVHYTPAALVNYLTSQVLTRALDGLSPDQVLERRILDPSCGCGIFLIAALRYIFTVLSKDRQSELSLQERLNILGRTIFGTDVDAQTVGWAIRTLLLTAWEGSGRADALLVTVPDLSHHIVACDFLAPATRFAGEGIDVILGGPPFVRLQQMLHSDAAAVQRYKRAFRTARSGQFDLYILFIEKAIDLLAPNGLLAFSVSNTFLRSETGQVLRQLIGDRCQVHEIIDIEDPKIYPDAVIQIALIVLQKSVARSIGRHVWIRGKGQLQQKLSALASGSCHALVQTRPLPPEVIRSKQWFFQSAEETELLSKIEAIGKPLGDLAIHIGQGVVTGADDVFLLRSLQQEKDGQVLVKHRDTGRQFCIESALLRPIIRNRDIRGYARPTPTTLCLIPYDASGKILNEHVLREEFPQAYHYLVSSKAALLARRRKRAVSWYAFSSVAAFRFPGRTKIIGGSITSGHDMTIHLDSKVLCHSSVLVMTPNSLILDPYYVLGVCNSNVFWAFVQHRMPTMGVGRHTLRLERLRKFPLVVPCRENQAFVQAIASAARGLVVEPMPLRREATVVEIDRMVHELYRLAA